MSLLADAGVRRRRAVRVLLLALALSAAAPGLWAWISPHGFYDAFPGGGRHWVRALPPYNEHLTLDVGAFYLAFALLFGWAARKPEGALVLPVCVAWALFSALHLAFHLSHLTGFGTSDGIAEMASLAVVLLMPAAAAWLVRPRPSPRAPRGSPRHASSA